jgi:hypothetical protein
MLYPLGTKIQFTKDILDSDNRSVYAKKDSFGWIISHYKPSDDEHGNIAKPVDSDTQFLIEEDEFLEVPVDTKTEILLTLPSAGPPEDIRLCVADLRSALIKYLSENPRQGGWAADVIYKTDGVAKKYNCYRDVIEKL